MEVNPNSSPLVVHNIYVKDVSYESPNTPHVFGVEWNPELNFDLSMSHGQLEDKIFEVVLSITASVSILPAGVQPSQTPSKPNPDAKTAFLVEVKQAGIFELQQAMSQDDTEKMLLTMGPTILFPYAREVVSSSVVRGGFPQLILPPMNFDAMYQQHLERQQQAS